MAKNNVQAEIYGRYKKDPFEFIKDMRGIVPQRVLPQHKEKLFSCRAKGTYDDMELDDFEPFIKGKHMTWQQAEFVLCVKR